MPTHTPKKYKLVKHHTLLRTVMSGGYISLIEVPANLLINNGNIVMDNNTYYYNKSS
jgi:hypothetical protein